MEQDNKSEDLSPDTIFVKSIQELTPTGNSLYPQNSNLAILIQNLISANFKKTRTGWTLRSDGSAEFNQGVFPVMSETERDAIPNPGKGWVIYNTDTDKLNVYTTAWEEITSA